MLQDVGQVDVTIATDQDARTRVARAYLSDGGNNSRPRRHIAARGGVARAENKARARSRRAGSSITPELKPLSAVRGQVRERAEERDNL
eukprot:1143114-Pyramimonas_sp.AAC.1